MDRKPAGGKGCGRGLGLLSFPQVSGGSLLCAVLLGAVALGIGLLAFDRLVLPGNGRADASKLYDYVYAQGKSENVDFVTNNMSDDGHLCFGSSEWYVSKNRVSMCPQAVFGENSAGVDMTYIGEGYDQSLWQAIAAGAYGSSGKVRNRKVMVVVSPQWFFKGSGDEDKFYTKFSYSLYRACMQSAQLSDQTKAYLRRRCSELGIDAQRLAAASHDTPLDAINDAAFAAADSWRLRSQIPNIVSLAPTKSATRASGQPTGEPTGARCWPAPRPRGRRPAPTTTLVSTTSSGRRTTRTTPSSSRTSTTRPTSTRTLPACSRCAARWALSRSSASCRFMASGMTRATSPPTSDSATTRQYARPARRRAPATRTSRPTSTRGTSCATRCIRAGRAGCASSRRSMTL